MLVNPFEDRSIGGAEVAPVDISMPSLMGEAFMEYYPTVLDDIWALDDAFNYLAIGLPRWFPIRRLTKAHLAHTRLNAALAELHIA